MLADQNKNLQDQYGQRHEDQLLGFGTAAEKTQLRKLVLICEIKFAHQKNPN